MKSILKIYECAVKVRRDEFYRDLVEFYIYKAVKGFSHGRCGAGDSPLYCIYLACDKKVMKYNYA